MLSFLKPILLPLIKQICFRTSQIHNFATSISILPRLNTLPTIISIRNTHPTTNDTPPFKRSVITLIANMNNGGRIDEGIANDAFAIAFFAKTSDGDARLFSAHYQIWMMLGHFSCLFFNAVFVRSDLRSRSSKEVVGED